MRMTCSLLAVISLTLGGCYELPRPIFLKGEHAAISGTYLCSGLDTRKDTLTEQASGVFFKDYRYVTASGDVLTLRRISEALYAAQIESQSRVFLSYLDISNPGAFSILVPDLFTNAHQLDAIASANHITSRPSPANSDFILLNGTDDDLATFVTAHKGNVLSILYTCTRQTT